MTRSPGLGWTASPAPGTSSPTLRRWDRRPEYYAGITDNKDSSDDQMAGEILRAQGRDLSRGLQSGAPQAGEADDGLILVLTLSILK